MSYVLLVYSSFTSPSCAKLHCKVIVKELHCQWPNSANLLIQAHNRCVSSINLVKVWLKKETLFLRKKALIWPKKGQIMYCKLTCTLMCIGVSYYYSVKSFSCSKNLTYTYALKLFWKRITTESHELSLECCWKENLQFKWQSLNSTTPEF